MNSVMLWSVNIIVALLATVNTVAWGFCIREVGDPKPSIEFLIRLAFNKWFILAMTSAFVASILSYIVLQRMGVLAGRFFTSLSIVATMLAGVLILKEKFNALSLIGIVLIIIGTILIGIGKY